MGLATPDTGYTKGGMPLTVSAGLSCPHSVSARPTNMFLESIPTYNGSLRWNGQGMDAPSQPMQNKTWERYCFSSVFKFTLQPPYRIRYENLLSLIWDTSHWNFFLKFGLKTAYDMS